MVWLANVIPSEQTGNISGNLAIAGSVLIVHRGEYGESLAKLVPRNEDGTIVTLHFARHSEWNGCIRVWIVRQTGVAREAACKATYEFFGRDKCDIWFGPRIHDFEE